MSNLTGDAGRVEQDTGEAVEVDRLIRGLRPAGRRPSGQHPVLSVGAPRVSYGRIPMQAGAVRVCVGLGVLLGIALPQWPYPRACDWWLLFYLFAAGMVAIAGIWGARLTWERRLGFTHTVALGTMLWGLILTAQEVLPRVGYAKTEATWTCTR